MVDFCFIVLVARQGKLRSSPLAGAKYLKVLQRHVAYLRDVPAHGNRRLHLHPLVLSLVSSFYNPAMRSLRTLEARCDLSAVTAGAIDKLCRSTTSDALAAFDPQLLLLAIRSLQSQIPDLARCDEDLCQITQQILAADGSYFSVFADVAWALHHTRSNGKKQGQVRLNLQLDVRSGLPQVLSVSGDEGSEPAAFVPDLLAGALYVIDRNFVDFGFLAAVLDHDSQFVLRIKAKAPGYEVIDRRVLSDVDYSHGVDSDWVVRLSGRGAPAAPMRLVKITCPTSGKPISLLTSLLEADARTIGLLYRRRWQIELFFRWLKVWANFDHLMSFSKSGITMQFYTAVIAVLVMYLHLGRRLSRYALTALHQIAMGQATLEQMLAYLDKREHEKTLEKARLARKKATQNHV